MKNFEYIKKQVW